VAYRISGPGSPGAPLTPADADTDVRLDGARSAELQRVFKRPWLTLAVHALAAASCCLTYAWLSANARVLGWALILLASLLAQGLLIVSYQRRSPAEPQSPRVWLRRFQLVVLTCATAWGLGPPWLRPPPAEAATWVLVLSMVLVAGAGANLMAAQRRAIWLWLLPLLGPLVVYLLSLPSTASRGLGGVVLIFMVLCWVFANAQRRVLTQALQAGLDKDRLVAALRHQVALVEQANREKSRFLASASHDLRQPMHALGLFAATLQRRLADTPLQPTVTHMLRAIDALDQSFNAMLDISKLDAGVIEPNLHSFPIRDLFRVLHMHCNGRAEERGLSLRFKAGGKIVTSDPHLLERVLSNLIHNAIRYTRQGGVVVVARTRREGCSIEVWDTGVGLRSDELPRVFEEFYQVDNPGRDRSSGLGMGLAIVKRLVLLMGHTLEVASRPGRGTVFRILLKATELAEMRNVVLGAETIPSEVVDERTVLLIDDEESILVGMSELLRGWGYRVLTAATINEACAAVHRHGDVIDIVVSDLRLAHQEDGIDAIERVRAAYGAPLPALLITGDTSAEQVKRAHESGHQVLFKPVRTRELFAALRSSL
jgi:two-component system, sensor histidine kinase